MTLDTCCPHIDTPHTHPKSTHMGCLSSNVLPDLGGCVGYDGIYMGKWKMKSLHFHMDPSSRCIILNDYKHMLYTRDQPPTSTSELICGYFHHMSFITSVDVLGMMVRTWVTYKWSHYTFIRTRQIGVCHWMTLNTCCPHIDPTPPPQVNSYVDVVVICPS